MTRLERFKKHLQSLRDRLEYSQKHNNYVNSIELEAMIVEAEATYIILLRDGYFKEASK